MSLIKWSHDPFAEFDNMFRQLPAMQNMAQMQQAFIPAIDMYEDKKNLVVEVPLSGIAPEDVEVSVEKGTLTIQGESKTEHEVDDKNYYRKEVRGGTFYRQVSLPVPVMEESVSAQFEDGVLKVVAPKTSPSKAKKVTVNIKGNKKE